MTNEQTPNESGISLEEDKTSQVNEDLLAGIPEEGEEEEKEAEEKKEQSEAAQKKHYREKFLKSQTKIRELEAKIEALSQKDQSTEVEERELAAQRYIREQARKEYENILAEQKAAEEKALEAFEERLEAVLDEHSEFTEDQILDICEEYEVEPEIAVKILTRSQEQKKKPELPKPKRASTEVKSVKKADDKGKTMYQIAREIIDGLKERKEI